MASLQATVALRPMAAHDIPMLHRWLQRPHVVESWGGERPTLAQVQARYLPRIQSAGKVTPYIGMLDGPPFAYAQSYVALGAGDGWWEDETDPGVRGIDQFIADPGLLGRGLGTRLARVLVDRLFSDPRVSMVQADPSPHDLRAIRCYEKAGLRRIRTIDTPDGPALHMLRHRPAAGAGAQAVSTSTKGTFP
ncbi:GNAT family N-acetyltransferase [Pseudorhodoferax sp.]|uniref:GNAT family N-acetyltransferase n=1 Tax=Pseudorhodoferax sp. TaxID=1993553 RepID=UPI0039E360E7